MKTLLSPDTLKMPAICSSDDLVKVSNTRQLGLFIVLEGTQPTKPEIPTSPFDFSSRGRFYGYTVHPPGVPKLKKVKMSDVR